MKITINLIPATVEEIRDITATYTTGGQLTTGDVVTAMTILATLLRKLPAPKKSTRRRVNPTR